MIVYKTKQNCSTSKFFYASICNICFKLSVVSHFCELVIYWFPSHGAMLLFLAGTFRLSSVASDFRLSVKIGNERGTSRLLLRLGSLAFIDLVRPGSSERLLVCPGESPLKKYSICDIYKDSNRCNHSKLIFSTLQYLMS